jgi:hypothetical protein
MCIIQLDLTWFLVHKGKQMDDQEVRSDKQLSLKETFYMHSKILAANLKLKLSTIGIHSHTLVVVIIIIIIIIIILM